MKTFKHYAIIGLVAILAIAIVARITAARKLVFNTTA